MQEPVYAAVKDGDRSLELRIDACRVFLEGELAGDIEIDLAYPAHAVERAFDCLRVQTSGEPASDVALGNDERASGIRLIFLTD